MTRREQYKFLGREVHWGYEFLVWTLVANPLGTHELRRRWVRWVR